MSGGFSTGYTGVTEEYNGTSWSSSNSMNVAKSGPGAGAGIQTAALAYGGDNGTGILSATEEYDGTSWTSVSSLNTARTALGGDGTTAAAVAFGGRNPTQTTATEEWLGAGSPTTKTITVS